MTLHHDRPRTLGELRAAGWHPRSVKDEMRANLIARIRSGEPLFPGIVGYEQDRRSRRSRTRSCRSTTSSCSACAARPRRASCARSWPFLDEWMPAIEGCPLHDDPFHPHQRVRPAHHGRAGERDADRVGPPRRALPGEAGHARRDHRRPDRRHRPDQGRHAQARLRRRGGHPLRHRAAHQPRHLRHQRAARPAAAHPGRPAEHPRGEGLPDPRLPGAHPARRAAWCSRPTPRTTRTAATSSRRCATASTRRS